MAANKASGTLMIFNLPLFSFNPYVKMIKSTTDYIHDFTEKLIKERREKRRQSEKDKTIENGIPDDILTTLMDSGRSRTEINEQMTTLLSAGHETSANFGAFTSFLLAKHPDVQEKARDEIFSVLNGREYILPEDIPQLKYLSAVLKESFRIYTIIPGLPRYCNKDTILTNKVLIPRNSSVYLPLTVVHRDPTTWTDYRKFDPDRFVKLSIGESCAKKGYFPFSYGPRSCIGSTLAMVETTVALAMLLQKVSLSVDNNDKVEISYFGISLVPAGGIYVKVSPCNGR